jgi:DnaJ-class molecular chaperone
MDLGRGICLFFFSRRAATEILSKSDTPMDKKKVSVSMTSHAAVDYYELLGVTPFASNAEIRRAARKRRADVHPDRHRGEAGAAAALAMAQEVNAAADVLADPQARLIYDASLAKEEADPFAGFGFAGARCAWFDPQEIGGDEASMWSGLFEESPKPQGVTQKPAS